jgi:hypothetical protein
VPNLAMQNSQAPATAPIPPLPPTPGAATGGQAGAPTPAAQSDAALATARDAMREAIEAAQTASQAGEAVIVQPPRIRRDSDIPPEVIPIVGIVFGCVAFMVVFGPITRGIMRMIERRQENKLVQGPPIAQQLQMLQQSVDAMAIELERISESQRFQSKLMNEKSALLPKSGSV